MAAVVAAEATTPAPPPKASPASAAQALREVLEGKIKVLLQQQQTTAPESGGGRNRGSNGGVGALQRLEVLWDLPDTLATADGKLLADASVAPVAAKLANLLLSPLQAAAAGTAGAAHTTSGGGMLQRLVGVSLATLHVRVPTRQLFSLVDSLHAVLTSSATSSKQQAYHQAAKLYVPPPPNDACHQH